MLKNSGEIKWTIAERKNKIKFQTVFLGILFLLFLFLTAAGVGVWKKYRDRLMENQFEQLQISARSLAGSMETSMKEYIWDFHILESIQDHETATPWEDTQKYSAYLNEGNSFVEDVFWINKDGEFLGSISGKKFQDPVFLTESKEGIYFLQMEDEKGKRYIVLKEKPFTEKQFCIAVDEEEYYQKLISRIRVGENGYVVVKNSDGKIIMHPEYELWGIDVIEGIKYL